MEKKDDVFDIKVKFLYETANSFVKSYFDAICEAYVKLYSPGDKRDFKLRQVHEPLLTIEDLSPAMVMDDLACIMYEYEEKVKYEEQVKREEVDS